MMLFTISFFLNLMGSRVRLDETPFKKVEIQRFVKHCLRKGKKHVLDFIF